jgi:hypothetical protein
MNAVHLLLALALPFAQAKPAPAPGAPYYLVLPSISYGAPLRTSASVALFRSNPNPRQEQLIDGWIAEGGAGRGGVRFSAGYASFLEYLGLDLRGAVTRTFGSPRSATPRSTYAGVEGGITIAYARFTVGIARRLGGSGDKAAIFSWTAGVQIPIK